MANRKRDNDWWILLGLAVGAVVLYYLETGREDENNAALIPDKIEDQIDLVVAKLKEYFGKDWVDNGIDVLKNSLRWALPAALVRLVGVVSAVEQMSKQRPMTGAAKQQTAVVLARTGFWS